MDDCFFFFLLRLTAKKYWNIPLRNIILYNVRIDGL